MTSSHDSHLGKIFTATILNTHTHVHAHAHTQGCNNIYSISVLQQVEGKIIRDQRTTRLGNKGTANVVKQGRSPIPADVI